MRKIITIAAMIVSPLCLVAQDFEITPNGDGNNDTWEVTTGNELAENNSVAIYNRRGDLVYNASPYKNDWNGEDIQGELLPNDSYYYILDDGINATPQIGFLTLDRAL